MTFASQALVHAAWGVPLGVGLLMLFSARRRARALAALAEEPTREIIARRRHPRAHTWRALLWLGALVLFLTALARPQWGHSWEDLKRRGLDIMVVLDTSKSMLATDIRPDRLQRAKMGVRDLLGRLKGDRAGLVAFAGTAFLQCPLTIDYAAFDMCLEDVNAGIIGKGGTDVAGALREARRGFGGKTGKESDRVILLISDGEDHEGGVEEILRTLKKEGIRVFCVGVGSPQGELITLRERDGTESYLKNPDGTPVLSRLNEEVMERIALGTGGVYVRAVQSDFGVDRLYDEVITKLKRDEAGARRVKRPHERYLWFALAGFVLLMIESAVPRARRGGNPK